MEYKIIINGLSFIVYPFYTGLKPCAKNRKNTALAFK